MTAPNGVGAASGATRTIVGIFADRTSAERALDDLKRAGFGVERMGVVLRDPTSAQDQEGITPAEASAPEERELGVTTGAVTGSVIGGATGALLAATGALVVPGIGPFLAAGILANALIGGVAGWLIGGLTGLGVPESEAQYYQSRVEQGRVLVTIDAGGREAEARAILARNGAEDTRDALNTQATNDHRELPPATTELVELTNDPHATETEVHP